MTLCEKLQVLVRDVVGGHWFDWHLLQMPDSRPTAKQLASLLKETDNTAVGLDDSIGGRTFIVID